VWLDRGVWGGCTCELMWARDCCNSLPRDKVGWMEMGKLMLDINRPDAALQAFENVLRFDRAFPGHDSSAGMRGD